MVWFLLGIPTPNFFEKLSQLCLFPTKIPAKTRPPKTKLHRPLIMSAEDEEAAAAMEAMMDLSTKKKKKKSSKKAKEEDGEQGKYTKRQALEPNGRTCNPGWDGGNREILRYYGCIYNRAVPN